MMHEVKMDKKDCVLLKMYGDGKQFTQPVWFSCGKCKKCEREPMHNDLIKRTLEVAP